MEFAQLIEKILQTYGPAVALLIAGLWYMHKQIMRKDGEIDRLQGELRSSVAERISDTEKRLEADKQTKLILEKVHDKSGATGQMVREAFDRLEENQKLMMSELRRLKDAF